MTDFISEFLKRPNPEIINKIIADEKIVSVDNARHLDKPYQRGKLGDETKQKWFNRVNNSLNSQIDENELKEFLSYVYVEIQKHLSYYIDAPESTIQLIALWILASYFHDSFPTFPVLYINAMRGSGKTRTLNCISHLALGQPGRIQNSISESALFHSKKEVLCIDEFEPKATEKNNLVLLLNSCYKRGSKVRRMKKVKNKESEGYETEEHDLYIPVVLGNINGLDNVLQDRALIVYLERSFDKIKSSRIEDFDIRLKSFKQELVTGVTGMTGMTHFTGIINGWNDYLDSLNIDTLECASHVSHVSLTDDKKNDTCHKELYTKIYNAGISGRSLEISFPLLIVASLLNEKLFNSSLKLFSGIAKQRKQSEMDDAHILILRFISTLNPLKEEWTPTELYNKFTMEFAALDLGLNVVSFSMALNRLQLITKRSRTGNKRLLHLDIKKATERIGLFDAETSK